jgi:hypothetical protein
MKFKTNNSTTFVLAIIFLLAANPCNSIEHQDFEENYENTRWKSNPDDSGEEVPKYLPVSFEVLYRMIREGDSDDENDELVPGKRDGSGVDKKHQRQIDFRRQLARWDVGFGKRAALRRQLARWDVGFGKRSFIGDEKKDFRTKSYMNALYGKRSDYY